MSDLTKRGTILKNDDPSQMLSIWNTLFPNTLNSHASVKRKRRSSIEAPWITTEIRKAMFERDNFKKKQLYQKPVALGRFSGKHRIELLS